MVAEAYRTREAMIDETTGLPRWWTHNPDSDLGFKVSKGVNFGDQELTKVRNKRTKSQQLKDGEYDIVEAYSYSGKALPTYEEFLGIES